MTGLRKGNRFRFTLQWGIDTQERSAAGEFLERLGNKKSDIVVTAIWEYLQRHPEAMAPEARLKVTAQPVYNRKQMVSEIKGIVKAYLEETRLAIPVSGETDQRENKSAELSEDDLNSMLENLDMFDL